jgi:SAM-dependent methyltransferase
VAVEKGMGREVTMQAGIDPSPAVAHSGELAVETGRIKRLYWGYDNDPKRRSGYCHLRSSNVAAWAALSKEIHGLLAAHQRANLEQQRIIDVGCGFGRVLAAMRLWGARDENLLGVDLLPWRVTSARENYPTIRFECQNAMHLALNADSFDLALIFTVFSSLRSDHAAHRISAEITRILRPGGTVLWYDLRIPSPRNRNVRPVPRRKIGDLFLHYSLDLRPVTTPPPIARWAENRGAGLAGPQNGRAAGPAGPQNRRRAVVAATLGRVGAFRSHYLGLLTSPGRSPMGRVG